MGETAIEQVESGAEGHAARTVEGQHKWMEMLSRSRSESPDQRPCAADRGDDVEDRFSGGGGVFFVRDQRVVGGPGHGYAWTEGTAGRGLPERREC